MATIAKEVYDTVPPDPLAPAGVNPCTFSSALDTVCGLLDMVDGIFISIIGSTRLYIPKLGRVVEEPKGCPFACLKLYKIPK